MNTETTRQSLRNRPQRSRPDRNHERPVNYQNLRNPFQPQGIFSDDEVESLHQNALRVLQDLGIKVLLPEARARFAKAGAIVDEDTHMVRIGSDIVEAAIASAPRSIKMRGADPARDFVLEPGALTFLGGGGCPHATDLIRGRRPGSFADFSELMKLIDSFDALAMLQAAVEPQDLPIHTRVYDVTREQLVLSPKVPFQYARGTEQVNDAFEMIRLYRGIDQEEFESACFTKTVINTNSPRQLDILMAQGVIDFALQNQLTIITPFCLLGAMAPLSVAGALSLQHAEALAGISLAQITRPGAPVLYGSFASNVDMKSGSPSFGTPEHIKATLGSGQLARRIDLPWRSSTGCAANSVDGQAIHETQMSTWAAVMAGATMIIHSAGWLEGGLTIGYEKLVSDMEMVQTFAELCASTPATDAELAFDAIKDVEPGGHFFSTPHTMERYATAFYEPLVASGQNVGQWIEEGSLTSEQRATDVWRKRLAEHVAPQVDQDRLQALEDFIARRKAAGGAPPVS